MSESIYKSPDADLQSGSSETVSMTVKDILFSFQGRIGRGKFWAASIGAGVVFYAISLGFMFALPDPTIGIAVMGILFIPLMWISLAVQAKRWHDRNKSAWWILINFVPIIGLWGLIETGFLAGDEGANNFGAPAAK